MQRFLPEETVLLEVFAIPDQRGVFQETMAHDRVDGCVVFGDISAFPFPWVIGQEMIFRRGQRERRPRTE